jgi:hypothetical protein
MEVERESGKRKMRIVGETVGAGLKSMRESAIWGTRSGLCTMRGEVVSAADEEVGKE